MDNKEQYRKLCETEGSSIPLFLQYWWMEAVCQGKRWDVALAYSHGGAICAAMPYLTGRKYGLRYVLQPQLTQYNGPWFVQGCDTADATLQLWNQMKSLHPLLFVQSFAPDTPHIDLWEGYTPMHRITYRIEDISDPQQVYATFDKSRRQRQIRRAERTLIPDTGLSASQFAQFHAQYWESRGQRDLLPQQLMVHVIETAQSRGQGLLLGLRDAQGTLQAARFVAYDNHSAYSLLSALAPGHANGASALLFWHIIQQLSGRTRSFDFEGSMDPGIAYSYSLYGAQPTPYYQLVHYGSPLVRVWMKNRL